MPCAKTMYKALKLKYQTYLFPLTSRYCSCPYGFTPNMRCLLVSRIYRGPTRSRSHRSRRSRTSKGPRRPKGVLITPSALSCPTTRISSSMCGARRSGRLMEPLANTIMCFFLTSEDWIPFQDHRVTRNLSPSRPISAACPPAKWLAKTSVFVSAARESTS